MWIACNLTLERAVFAADVVADRRFLENHRGYSFLDAVEAEGIHVV